MFVEISKLLNDGEGLVISTTKHKDRLVVSFIPSNKNTNITPAVMSCTPEELDDKFCDVMSKVVDVDSGYFSIEAIKGAKKASDDETKAKAEINAEKASEKVKRGAKKAEKDDKQKDSNIGLLIDESPVDTNNDSTENIQTEQEGVNALPDDNIISTQDEVLPETNNDTNVQNTNVVEEDEELF